MINDTAPKENDTDRAFKAFTDAIDQYRQSHGENALKCHVFTLDAGHAYDQSGLQMRPTGFPVLVKHHDENSVVLINLSDGSELTVTMRTYIARCNNLWIIDEGLMLTHPDRFKRYQAMLSQGMIACGFEQFYTDTIDGAEKQ